MLDEVVLRDDAEDVAAGDEVAHLELRVFTDRVIEFPRVFQVERGYVDAPWDEAVAAHVRDGLQRALDPVEDVTHDPRPELHGQRLPRARHRVPHGEPRGFLVALDGRGLALQADDLADELVAADSNELVHRRAVHVVRHHDGAGHLRIFVGWMERGRSGWAKTRC